MSVTCRILGESTEPVVALAKKVVRLVAHEGGRKRQLLQVLDQLRKVHIPDPTVDLALRGDLMDEPPNVDLVGALEQFMRTYDDTQDFENDSWDPDEAEKARFPVMDIALTILNHYGQLTDKIYMEAYERVSAWEDFPGFTSGSRPHIDAKFAWGIGP